MTILLFFAMMGVFAILLSVGLLLFVRSLILKKNKWPGILFSLFGGIPLLLIGLFIYYTIFYYPDSSYKQAFTNDTHIELPASARIIHKNNSPQIWTDYDNAAIIKMDSGDYNNLMIKLQKDSIFQYDDNVFISSSGRDVMEKANISEKDIIWFENPGTHCQLIGFHTNKKWIIYIRYRY